MIMILQNIDWYTLSEWLFFGLIALVLGVFVWRLIKTGKR